MGNITIEIDILKEIRGLPADKRKSLMDDLSTEPEIIECVASQILYGTTEMGSCGCIGNAVDLWTDPYPTALTAARRHLLAHADAAMREQAIDVSKQAEHERVRHTEVENKSWEELIALRHKNQTLQNEINVLQDEIKSLHERLT